ncbi:MAG: hemerythrin domain-containing protein [Rhodanobacter sp.]
MNFFARKQPNERLDVTFEEQLAEQQVAPGTQLHYDSRLIQRLRGHAAALLELIAQASQATQASKFEDAKKNLYKFRQLFNEHLLEKNLRLYTYLSCCLKSDLEGSELTREMRRETGEISRQAMDFITRYSDAGIQEGNRTSFLGELTQLCEVLSERFAREERTLYTLYRPPQSYQAPATRAPRANILPRSEIGRAVLC